MIDTVLLVVLMAFLILVVVIDIKTLRIPDWLTVGIGGLGLAYIFVVMELERAVAHAGLGAIAFGFLFLITRIVISNFSNQEALGLGDVKFAASAGIWLGIHALPMFLLASSLSTLLVVFGMSYAMHGAIVPRRAMRIPFGPGLAFATALSVLIQRLPN